MCIIIYKQKGVNPIKEEWLEMSYENNPDGIGFTVKDRYYLVSYKGFEKFETFMNFFDSYNKEEYEVAIHFRKKSRGKVSGKMSHPFPLLNKEREMVISDKEKIFMFVGPSLMHNGTFKSINASEGKSDTYVFARTLRHYMQKGMELGDFIKKFKDFIEERIDTNRLLIMDYEDTYIINESLFENEDGILFSNKMYKEKRTNRINCSNEFGCSYSYGYGYSYGTYGYNNYYNSYYNHSRLATRDEIKRNLSEMKDHFYRRLSELSNFDLNTIKSWYPNIFRYEEDQFPLKIETPSISRLDRDVLLKAIRETLDYFNISLSMYVFV